MYLRLKMPFWALSGCNSRKKLLFQLYYYYYDGAFEALGWVLTGKFPSPASQQLFHQKLFYFLKMWKMWNIPASTGWHHWCSPGAPEPSVRCPFFPKFAFLRWCRWLHGWGEGDLFGNLWVQTRKKKRELPLGMLITEFGCCTHIDIFYIYLNLYFGVENHLFIWVQDSK